MALLYVATRRLRRLKTLSCPNSHPPRNPFAWFASLPGPAQPNCGQRSSTRGGNACARISSSFVLLRVGGHADRRGSHPRRFEGLAYAQCNLALHGGQSIPVPHPRAKLEVERILTEAEKERGWLRVCQDLGMLLRDLLQHCQHTRRLHAARHADGKLEPARAV